MTEYQEELLFNLGVTVKQFEVLEDVLSEVEESRVYGEEDKIALDALKEFFSFRNYKDYRDRYFKEGV